MSWISLIMYCNLSNFQGVFRLFSGSHWAAFIKQLLKCQKSVRFVVYCAANGTERLRELVFPFSFTIRTKNESNLVIQGRRYNFFIQVLQLKVILEGLMKEKFLLL